METAVYLHKLKIKMRTLRDRAKFDPSQVPQAKGEFFEVNKWQVSEFVEYKLLPITGHRPFPLTEQVLLASAACFLRPSHIFDWGTNIGVSARLFYETCKHFEINSEIHSIDLPMDQDHGEHPRNDRGKLVRALKNVFLHEGDGAEKAVEIAKSAEIKNPLFFLDGDHSYETVCRELEYISQHIESPNFIIHDTFLQSQESDYNVGPHLAVKEFVERNPGVFQKMECNLGLPGMTFLKRL
ncbi:MAG: cephalosporin hydroxylase [Bacteriovoracaceae bacterium]|jgi:cephalosporin hydroxylase